MMAGAQRTSRRVRWECTAWQITETFLSIWLSSLTFDPAGFSAAPVGESHLSILTVLLETCFSVMKAKHVSECLK